MITKGIVRKVPQNSGENMYIVWLPFFDDPMADAEETLLEATLSEAAGIQGGYSVGDIVYCAFEDNSTSRPVILGKLSSPDQVNDGGKLDAENLTITRKAVLPRNTKVGDVQLGEVLSNIININGTLEQATSSTGKYVRKIGDTMTGPLAVPEVITLKVGGDLTSSNSGDTWSVRGIEPSKNANALEIAVGSGGDEPVYVTQYVGNARGGGTINHRATLLDASGNTDFPGQITSGGSITAGSTADTSERQVKVSSGAGTLYMYSQSSSSGSRGLYVPAHGTGSAKAVISIDTNNNASFAGSATSATSATQDGSGNTITTYYQKKITVSQSDPSGGSNGDIWIQY